MRDYTNFDKFLDERILDAHPNYNYANVSAIHLIEWALDRMMGEYKLPAGAKVIDMGCGDGRDCLIMKERGLDPTGLNFLQIDLDKAPNSFTKVLADQSFPPFDNDTFDAVFSRHCLEHSIMPYFTLVEYNRILKMDGLAYIEVPTCDSPKGFHEQNPNHYSLFGLTMWKELFTRAGFDLLIQTKADFDIEGELIDTWHCFFLQKKRLTNQGYFRDAK